MGKGPNKNTTRKGGNKRSGNVPADSDAESDNGKNSDSDAESSTTAANSLVFTSSEAINAADVVLLLSESVEMLSEKRTSTRESGLKNLLKILRSSNKVVIESVHDFVETLTSDLSRMLRRPSSLAEGTLSTQVLSLLCLLMGEEESSLFETFEKVLVKIINGGSSYDELRIPALATLAFICFICSNDSTEGVMDVCEDIMCEVSE